MIIIKASKATLVHYMNEGWLTNWGIQKFFPWRPLKIEKKVFVKKVVSWHYALHAIEKKILSRTASTQPPKNQILWCKNFLSSSTKNWLTNWGIWPFLPWRPLKIEKKVVNINIRSWHYALNAIDQSLLSQTASTQPPKNRILLWLSSSTRSGWYFFCQKMTTFQGPTTSKIGLEFFL